MRHTTGGLPRSALGRTGIEVSLLGFGAEALGRKGRAFEDAQATLNAVLDLGVTLVDTASAYGNSEAFIGKALAERYHRGDFTIVTKCGWVNDDYRPAWSPQELAQTVDESLRRLRIDVIDVLLLHSCDVEMLKQGEVVAALQHARDQGKARHIGYSGDNAALAFAVHSGVFDVVECSYSLLDQANGPMIEAASAKDIGVMIKRPIANGVPGATTKPRSDYAAQYWPRWQEIGLRDSDVEGLPWLEAALRFSAYQPGVSSVLIGSSHVAHMRDNARTLGSGALAPATIERLRTAFARVGRDWPALG